MCLAILTLFASYANAASTKDFGNRVGIVRVMTRNFDVRTEGSRLPLLNSHLTPAPMDTATPAATCPLMPLCTVVPGIAGC